MLRRFRHIINNGFPWFVAEEVGVVLAYAYASPFRTRPAYRWAIEDSVYVAPEAKGKGTGKLLLQGLRGSGQGKRIKKCPNLCLVTFVCLPIPSDALVDLSLFFRRFCYRPRTPADAESQVRIAGDFTLVL